MANDFSGTLTWVGHSTFLLITPGGRRILFDPFIEDNPTAGAQFRGDGVGEVDLILVSHGHGDHLGDVVAQQARTGAQVAGMVELLGWFGTQGVPADKRIAFNKGGTIEPFEGVRVTMVHAQHSSSAPDGTYVGEAAGFVVELEDGYRIYFAGDTNVFGDMRIIGELYMPDLAILPIGGHYTMDPREAAMAAELLGVPDVVGMHWGTFPPLTGTPQQLAALLSEVHVTVHELEPGDSLRGGAGA
ncbi:MAG: hydrolase [Thermoleophilia bacterium]|nr:hydrolase [Thermoleophilia bacterium]